MAGRRKFSKAFKRQVVEEFLAEEVTQAQLARRFGMVSQITPAPSAWHLLAHTRPSL